MRSTNGTCHNHHWQAFQRPELSRRMSFWLASHPSLDVAHWHVQWGDLCLQHSPRLKGVTQRFLVFRLESACNHLFTSAITCHGLKNIYYVHVIKNSTEEPSMFLPEAASSGDTPNSESSMLETTCSSLHSSCVHVTLHTLSATFPELYLELSETLTQPNYPNPSAEPIRRTQLFGARNIGRGRKTCWFQCQTIMALQHCYLSWWDWELEILVIVTVPWPEKPKGALKRYLDWKLCTNWNSKWLSVQQSLQPVPLLQALSEHAYSNMFEIVIVNQSGKLWQIRRCIFTCVILHYTTTLWLWNLARHINKYGRDRERERVKYRSWDIDLFVM